MFAFIISVTVSLTAGFIAPETGCVLPMAEYGLEYSSAEVLPAGVGEWTRTGPWGGNIKALAVSSVDSNLVLAGCGFSMASDAGGIYRSTDGGAAWAETELFPIQVNDVCAAGPLAPETFYAATRTGLYRSTDEGVTWETVAGMASSYVIGIGVHEENSDILIAGLSSNNGIRRSDDGGATWAEVGMGSGYMKGLGCDPEHPDTMYLAMSGLDNSLYRSTDAGLSWSPVGPSGSGWAVLVAPFGTGESIIVTTSDGFYMSQDHGANWDLVAAGSSYAPAVCDGTNLYAPVISAGGVYESTDQGTTWTLNTQGIIASYWQAGCASSQGYLAGHYGGVYSAPSPGMAYTVSQQGISNGFFHAVSYLAGPGTLFAGGDHHGLWRSTDLGENWEIVFPGPADWSIYDIAPQSDLHYTGQVMYAATGSGVFRSQDGGDSWAPAGLSGTQISSVAFDPSNPDNAWAGTASSGVHYTTDAGATWTPGSGFPFALYPSIELMENGSGDLRVLVSFQQNGEGVYYSDDGGASYTTVAVPGSYHPDLSARYGPGLAPMGYLATDNGIYRSDDLGENWSPCPGSSGLMWEVQGEYDSNVFAGTNGSGIRRSPDTGSTWESLSEGIEDKIVWDIAYGASSVQLFASLRGFGLAELTEEELGVGEEEHSMSLTVTPSVNPVSSSVTFTVAGAGDTSGVLGIYSADGRLICRRRVEGTETTWIPGEGTPAGIYLIRFRTDGGDCSTARVVIAR